MLSLSTDAAPHLSLDAIDAACRARGLEPASSLAKAAFVVVRANGGTRTPTMLLTGT